MKDSWKRVRLDDLGKHYGGLTNKTKDDFGKGKPYIPYLNIFTNGKVDKSYLELVDVKNNEHQNRVKRGDLFFTTSSETPHEAGMTSVLVDDIGEAYLNSFCFGFRLDNFDSLLPEFAVHLFRGKEVRKTISDLAQGSTRYNLSKSIFFEKVYLNLPSLPQQKKIAKILSTVDAVLDKTEAAIAKYRQIKQGLMQDLFTRGIDVNTGQLRPKQQDAPELYKQSELGWIPKAWDVEELGNNNITYAGGTPNRSIEHFYKGTIPWVSSGEVNKDSITDTKEKITDDALRFSSAKMVPSNSVLIALYGATAGQVSMLKINACTNQAVLAIIPNPDWNRYFIYYGLNFSKERILFLAQGSGQPNLNKGLIDSTSFWKPNLKEQTIIANKLQSIDQKIHTEQQALAKYQQLKAGLMQDLLTGRVEVGV